MYLDKLVNTDYNTWSSSLFDFIYSMFTRQFHNKQT